MKEEIVKVGSLNQKMVRVCLTQNDQCVYLQIPFVSDRLFELVTDGLVSGCDVTFEKLFEMVD